MQEFRASPRCIVPLLAQVYFLCLCERFEATNLSFWLFESLAKQVFLSLWLRCWLLSVVLIWGQQFVISCKRMLLTNIAESPGHMLSESLKIITLLCTWGNNYYWSSSALILGKTISLKSTGLLQFSPNFYLLRIKQSTENTIFLWEAVFSDHFKHYSSQL